MSTRSLLEIDGAMGEGGGQVLRSALALSLCTGRGFRIHAIRANRKKPGLMRQHLTAVRLAAEVGLAQVEGDSLGSTELRFEPTTIQPGEYEVSVGTAGSTTLILQTVLPALLQTGSPSRLLLNGGTHNPYAPPYDFLARSFLPILERMGASCEVRLLRPGFYPAGGGRFEIAIDPVERWQPLELRQRGEARGRRARAYVAKISPEIARRELTVVSKHLQWPAESLEVVEVQDSIGPGNIMTLEMAYESVTKICTGFGQLGVRAESVAARVVREAKEYLASDVPVGRYLADQLLLPMALAGKGMFRSLRLTRHTLTQIEVIRKFLPVNIEVERDTEQGECTVRLSSG